MRVRKKLNWVFYEWSIFLRLQVFNLAPQKTNINRYLTKFLITKLIRKAHVSGTCLITQIAPKHFRPLANFHFHC